MAAILAPTGELVVVVNGQNAAQNAPNRILKIKNVL